jgi:acetylornithine/succinyldiaminopimelate/putrescine aminotransferase
VLEIVSSPDFLASVCRVGAYLRDGLENLSRKHSMLGEVRGEGLMLGLEVERGAAVVTAARDQGLLVGEVGGNLLRFLPPLIIDEEDVDTGVAMLELAVRRVEES